MAHLHLHVHHASERAAWIDVFAAAPPLLRRRLGLEVRTDGGGTVLSAPGIDHLLFNRVIGLTSTERIAPIVEAYARSGVDRFFVHRDAATANAPYVSAGLAPYRRDWVDLERRGPHPVPAGRCALRIEWASRRHAAAFAHLILHGFDMPPEAAPLLAGLVDRPRWHNYVVIDGTSPIAAGALFHHGEMAHLVFASTDPAHRRHGAQSALLGRRLRVADALGCEVIRSETGAAVEGEPNPSENNMRRFGFRPVARRENWTLPGTGWLPQTPAVR